MPLPNPVWFVAHPLFQYNEDVEAIAEANGWSILDTIYDDGSGVAGVPLTIKTDPGTADEQATVTLSSGSVDLTAVNSAISGLQISQAAQDALIATLPSVAQVSAIQANNDAQDPFVSFTRELDDSIIGTKESGAQVTIAAPNNSAPAATYDTPLPAAGTAATDKAPSSSAVRAEINADRTRLTNLESASHDGAAQDAAIALNTAHRADTAVHMTPGEKALLHDGAAQDTRLTDLETTRQTFANLLTSIRDVATATDTNYVSEKAIAQALVDAISGAKLTDLSDTPAAMSAANARQFVRVDPAGNAAEFIALLASMSAFDNATATLAGAPATVQTAIEALKSLIDNQPTQTEAANFSALPAPGGVPAGSIYHAIDASDDPTVTTGWAKYQVIGGTWFKYLSQEELGAAAVALTNAQIQTTDGSAPGLVEGTVSGQLLFDREQFLKGVAANFDSADPDYDTGKPWSAKTLLEQFKPTLPAADQAAADTTSVLPQQKIQIGEGATHAGTFENISAAAVNATAANLANGQTFRRVDNEDNITLDLPADNKPVAGQARRVTAATTLDLTDVPATQGLNYWIELAPNIALTVPGIAGAISHDGPNNEIIHLESTGTASQVARIGGNVASTVDAADDWDTDTDYTGDDNKTFNLQIPATAATAPYVTANSQTLKAGKIYTLEYAADRAAADSVAAIADDQATVDEIALMNLIGEVAPEAGSLIRETLTAASNAFTLSADRFSWLGATGVTADITATLPDLSAYEATAPKRGVIVNSSGKAGTIADGGNTIAAESDVDINDRAIHEWYQTGPGTVIVWHAGQLDSPVATFTSLQQIGSDAVPLDDSQTSHASRFVPEASPPFASVQWDLWLYWQTDLDMTTADRIEVDFGPNADSGLRTAQVPLGMVRTMLAKGTSVDIGTFDYGNNVELRLRVDSLADLAIGKVAFATDAGVIRVYALRVLAYAQNGYVIPTGTQVATDHTLTISSPVVTLGTAVIEESYLPRWVNITSGNELVEGAHTNVDVILGDRDATKTKQQVWFKATGANPVAVFTEQAVTTTSQSATGVDLLNGVWTPVVAGLELHQGTGGTDRPYIRFSGGEDRYLLVDRCYQNNPSDVLTGNVAGRRLLNNGNQWDIAGSGYNLGPNYVQHLAITDLFSNERWYIKYTMDALDNDAVMDWTYTAG